jgi:hypothetical protein
MFDGMRAERGAMGHVEGALPGLGQSGAGGGYDNGISHVILQNSVDPKSDMREPKRL